MGKGLLKPYRPQDVVVYFGGILVDGFADGSLITLSPFTAAFDSVVGTNGEVALSPSGDKRVKAVIKLLQTSDTNKELTRILAKAIQGPNSAGIGTFYMQDLSGQTIIQGPQAWISGFPEADFDRTAKSREWEIVIANGIDGWKEYGNAAEVA